MQFVNADLEDIEAIFDLYDKAVEFQKTKSDKHWKGFDTALVENEIREKRLWKIVTGGGSIACIFSVAYSDPLIWGEKSSEPSLYIHRIVTNPLFRGRGFVKIIFAWAKEYGRKLGKKFIRMDTWADNQKLIDYYVESGFTFLGITTPGASKELPVHYEGISLSLFEFSLDKDTLNANQLKPREQK